MNGILLVDKPKGLTSRDVVNVVSKQFHTKKVGHTGTLDPLATGMLVLCIGNYTKFVSKLTNHDKEYVAVIRFGLETDTLDITGKVLKETTILPNRDTLNRILEKFIGPQKQEVPIYSAKKINGKKLYEYARNGEEVPLPVQDIEVYSIELLDFQENYAKVRFHVSKGTYIRSLIRDISHACGTLGVMEELRRTRLEDFSIQDASTLEDIEQGKYHLLTFHNFLDFETYEITEIELKRVLYGNELFLSSSSDYMLLTYQGKEIALYQRGKKSYVPLLHLTNINLSL